MTGRRRNPSANVTIVNNGHYRFTIVRRQKSVDVYFKDISTTPPGAEASFSYSSSTDFGPDQMTK